MKIKQLTPVSSSPCEYAGTDYECSARGLNCCDCGGREEGHGCGCAYCWSCNACEACYNEDN